MLELTEAQKIEDVATRMEKFKRALDLLIEEHNVYPQPEILFSRTQGAIPGLFIHDRKYQEEDIDNRARSMVLEKLLHEQEAANLVKDIINEPAESAATESADDAPETDAPTTKGAPKDSKDTGS